MNPQTHLRFWLGAFVAFLVIIWALKPMLLPFVAALAIAYFLNPFVALLCRHNVSRPAGASVVILLAIMAAIAIILLIVPLVQSQAASLINAIPTYTDAFRNRFMPWVMGLSEHLSPDDMEKLRTAASEHAGAALNWLAQMLKGLLSSGFALFDIITLMFITPLVAFYLLRDWDKMTQAIDRALPRRHYTTIRMQLNEIDRTLAGFVRGQGLVCIALGTFYATGLSIVGLDFGVAIGLTAGLISFIPYVGTAFGMITSLVLGAIQFGDWPHIAGILAVFGIGQIMEGYFLTPKLVGDRVGLHPVWIMFGLFAGASLLGFLGMLIAVPVSAVIGVLVRFLMQQYQASAFYQDDNPSPS